MKAKTLVNKNITKSNFRINFVGIGTSKSGTTWLADSLRHHKQVFIPKIKELGYFQKFLPDRPTIKNIKFNNSIDWYHSNFEGSLVNQIKGEFTPTYMIESTTAKRIYDYNSDIKIIAILRNPIHRAFSHYNFFIQKGYGNYSSFKEAIEQNPIFLTYGLYFAQLKEYFKIFPKKNIKILFYEDLIKDNKIFYKQVLDFLEIKEYYPDALNSKSNETKQVKFKFLNLYINAFRIGIHKYKLTFLLPILKKIGIIQVAELLRDKVNVTKVKKSEKEKIDPILESELKSFFLEDITKLEELLDVDLSKWKNKYTNKI